MGMPSGYKLPSQLGHVCPPFDIGNLRRRERLPLRNRCCLAEVGVEIVEIAASRAHDENALFCHFLLLKVVNFPSCH
jgi:hypothetical protein